MNIRGTEGLSPADLQAEIARGARFVAFQWCVSLGIVTFKRASRIHFLKPGDTGFAPGFVWSLVSLVAGWWGFPWGPIYTIGSLWTNLRGGLDVTEAVAADLANTHGAPVVAPLAGAPVAGPRWSAGALAALGLLGAAIAAVVGGVQFYERQHRPVAVANALDTAYVVTIDGTSHTLRPHSVVKLELPAGPHSVAASLPGGVGPTTFTFDVGAFTVVNPDGAALVAEETMIYTPESQPRIESPKPEVHAGRTSYSFSGVDCFLDEFPETLSMPKHASQVAKRRVAVHADLTYARIAEILLRYSDRPAMVAYFNALGARLPNDTRLLEDAPDALEPAETDAFFAQHLGTRPALVEWHRAYQNLRRARTPDTALANEYRRLAETDPDDGAFAYLYGRLLDDPVQDSTWFERALAAKQPCPHAHFALAYNSVARGDFAGALAGLDRAREAGLDNDTVREQRIECLLALGRPAEALEEQRRKPVLRADFSRANEELHLAFLAGGRPAAKQVADTFLARLPAAARKESGPEIRKGFDAQLAYFEGNSAAFADTIGADAQGMSGLTRALCRNDLAGAEKAVAGLPSQNSLPHLLLFLATRLAGDARAEMCWKNLVSAWAAEGGRRARLAAHFDGRASLAAAELLDFPMSPGEKRLFLAALGLHEPALRDAAFARAAQCNFSRQFPHHLVAAALATAKP